MKIFLNISLIATLLSISLVSCEGIQNETQTVNRYFDVDSLIDATIQKSLQQKESLQIDKTVEIDGKTEQKNFSVGEKGLEDEMKLFRNMDLNEPALAFAYNREQNGAVVTYSLKATEKQTGIIRLSVTKKESEQLIEGLFNENNQIYYTSRQLKLKVEKGTIQSYEMTGKQKMMFKDTIYYSMKGIILN